MNKRLDKVQYLTPDPLTSLSSITFENLMVPQRFKKLVEFYVVRMFIAVLTTARHTSLSWERL